MFIGRITGSLVSSQKVESMIGQKLLIVEPLRVDEKDASSLKPTGRTFITVDPLGCGEGRSCCACKVRVLGSPRKPKCCRSTARSSASSTRSRFTARRCSRWSK